MTQKAAIALWVLAIGTMLNSGLASPPDLDLTPQIQTWEIGVRIKAQGGFVSGIEATLPFPQDWPEQKTELLSIEQSDHIGGVSFRELGEGARQWRILMPRLAAHQEAQIVARVKITRYQVNPPTDPLNWHRPKRLSSKLKVYLQPSPYIESGHRLIKAAGKQALDGTSQEDWRQVEAIYDWVRSKVKYEFDREIRSSLAALKNEKGDCEELTSLFIAICRSQKIPARAVWVPGHCYPEFYLEKKSGEGRWFPCQAAGDRDFGGIQEWRPILQKGDRFKVPGKSGWQRYVAETLRAKAAQAEPEVEFFRRPVANQIDDTHRKDQRSRRNP